MSLIFTYIHIIKPVVKVQGSKHKSFLPVIKTVSNREVFTFKLGFYDSETFLKNV